MKTATQRNWKETTLAEVAEKIGMGPFGSNIKIETFVKEGVPIISGAHLRGTRLEDVDYNFVSREHADRLASANVRRGDVIFTHAGNIGQVAYIPKNSKYERYILSQRQFYLRPSQGLSAEYLTYYFHSPQGRHQLFTYANQVGVPSLAQPVSNLKSTPIALPPIEEQRSMVAVIASLDNKIELLRRENETLEQIAQTIFSEWFVKPTVNGALPQGWKIGTLGDVLEVKGGTTPSTNNADYWDGDLFWSTPKDLAGNQGAYLLSTASKITEKGLACIGSGLLPVGTLLLSSRAPIGYIAIAAVPLAINQGYIAINTRGAWNNYFTFLWLKSHMPLVLASSNGSTFMEISKGSFRAIETELPDDNTLRLFTDAVSPMFEKMLLNAKSIRSLATVRDALLPRLMSGELRTQV